jgi:hypothetical protein
VPNPINDKGIETTTSTIPNLLPATCRTLERPEMADVDMVSTSIRRNK